MSIAPPVGGLSAYLARMVSSSEYMGLRQLASKAAKKLSRRVWSGLEKAEEYARGMVTGGTMFEELGFYYVGPIDGHNLDHLIPVLENVRGPERGIVRGIGLLPGTPVAAIEPLLDHVDLILLVTINPGWGGQAFGIETPRRVEQVRNLLERTGRDIFIGLDGGVTRKNIADVAGLGPDLIITGSAVFDGKQPAENARYMLDAVRDAAKGS